MQTQMDSALNPKWRNQATAVSSIVVQPGVRLFEVQVEMQYLGEAGVATSNSATVPTGGGALLGGGDQIIFDSTSQVHGSSESSPTGE